MLYAADLEGEEFEDDLENLAAWHEAFGQHHYWAEQLGPVLAVGLSTVRFRSNKYRCLMQETPRLQMRVLNSNAVTILARLSGRFRAQIHC